MSFLIKKYEIVLLKLNGKLEIVNKINVNEMSKKFYYIANYMNKNNNNLIYKKNIIDIPNGNYDFNKLIQLMAY